MYLQSRLRRAQGWSYFRLLRRAKDGNRRKVFHSGGKLAHSATALPWLLLSHPDPRTRQHFGLALKGGPVYDTRVCLLIARSCHFSSKLRVNR